MVGELGIGNDVGVVDMVDRRQVIQHVSDHRFARDFEQRLRLGQRQRIKPRGVACRKND